MHQRINLSNWVRNWNGELPMLDSPFPNLEYSHLVMRNQHSALKCSLATVQSS
ncbi:hypothetical protein NSP_42810 [Nodularia spumigena CCY9414]|nr:hypothetical protein NSP_42810 [Nodularia spumigena CCY9414]